MCSLGRWWGPPCTAQLGFGLQMMGWKAKGERCMVQSLCETWCTAGLDLPLGVLRGNSHIQTAAPGTGPASLGGSWSAGWLDPWEGSGVLGGECQERVTPCTRPSLGISGLFSMCLYAGAVGLQHDSAGCSPASAPGCSPARSTAKSNPRPSPRHH